MELLCSPPWSQALDIVRVSIIFSVINSFMPFDSPYCEGFMSDILFGLMSELGQACLLFSLEGHYDWPPCYDSSEERTLGTLVLPRRSTL